MKRTSLTQVMMWGIGVLIAFALSGSAAGVTWQGAGTGGNTCTDPDNQTTQWGVTGNWDTASVPGAGETVYYNFGNAGAAYAGTATVTNICVTGTSDQAALHVGDGTDLVVTSTLYAGYSKTTEVGRLVQHGGTVVIDSGLRVGYYWEGIPGSGYYDLSGGELTVRYTGGLIGTVTGAIGVFTQTGGTHTTKKLDVGGGGTGTGSYNLSGGVLRMSDVDDQGTWCTLSVGSTVSTGSFTHTGGQLDLGGDDDTGELRVGAGGTYSLSGTGLIGGRENSHITVVGTLGQTGGTVDVDYLHLSSPSDDARYEMSGSATLSVKKTATIGGSTGAGTFAQSGGTFNVYELHVECDGSYELSGTGELVGRPREGGSSDWCAASIGMQATAGTFTQTAGTHTNGWLYVGCSPGSEGTYLLSDGELSCTREYISWERATNPGLGLMEQSGGANTCSQLVIASHGTYRYTGGTLDAGSITVRGDLDFDCSSVTLSMPGGILDVSEGTFSNASSAGLVIGSSGVLVVPEGYDPADAFGTYVNNGWTHVAGTELVIGPGRTLSGSGTISASTLTNSGGLAPGSSAGVLEIAGDYVQETAGDLLVEIGGYSHWSEEAGTTYDYDRLEITGSASLEGVIDVSLINGFCPVEGDTFNVLVADNGITIGSGGLALTGTPGFTWSLTAGDTTLQLEFTPIPEPATMLLVGTGLAGLVGVLRRRQRT